MLKIVGSVRTGEGKFEYVRYDTDTGFFSWMEGGVYVVSMTPPPNFRAYDKAYERSRICLGGGVKNLPPGWYQGKISKMKMSEGVPTLYFDGITSLADHLIKEEADRRKTLIIDEVAPFNPKVLKSAELERLTRRREQMRNYRISKLTAMDSPETWRTLKERIAMSSANRNISRGTRHTWVKGDGSIVAIKDIENSHLSNILNYLSENYAHIVENQSTISDWCGDLIYPGRHEVRKHIRLHNFLMEFCPPYENLVKEGLKRKVCDKYGRAPRIVDSPIIGTEFDTPGQEFYAAGNSRSLSNAYSRRFRITKIGTWNTRTGEGTVHIKAIDKD